MVDQVHSRKMSLEDHLVSRIQETTERRDYLTKASYFLLEARIVEDEKRRDFCLSRGYIALARFCKYHYLFRQAAEYYELCSEILSRDTKTSASAQLQLANSLTCRSKAALRESKFGEASRFLEQAAKLFKDLGKPKEVIFCDSKKLEAQAREFASVEDYEKASELLLEAVETIGQTNEDLAVAYQGHRFLYLAKQMRKREDYEKALKYYEDGAEKFRQVKNRVEEHMCRAGALECKAFLLKLDDSQNYIEISHYFMEASQEYSKVGTNVRQTWARISQGDAYKFLALDAKRRGARQEAQQSFMRAKSFFYEALHRIKSLRAKQFLKSSVLWCEGMCTAVEAERLLLENISTRKEMKTVINLLTRSVSLLSRAGDMKRAEMISGLTHFAMAIDAFHGGDIPEANAFVKEARSALPPKFLHNLLKSEVRRDWQPLRYALVMLESFDKYARKLETEKGYSFEGRARDLLRKMYGQYETIEEKTFNPKEDEIGIVFKDKTPVEIDALGIQKEGDELLLLVAEAKNILAPITFNEALKFVKKTQFVERRYAKIADLQSIEKPKLENKVFISTSRIAPSAKELLIKNNVRIIEGNTVTNLFKKFHLVSIPKFDISNRVAH